ncbi:MAG TPA: hypothetical protein VFX03_01240, partial [Thermomicrobiales bacterium]|nr:hypothetical protein [Thermomicrobiales bacterium]
IDGAGADHLTGGAGADSFLLASELTSDAGAKDVIHAGGGNDVIDIRSVEPSVIDGGAGADTLIMEFGKSQTVVLHIASVEKLVIPTLAVVDVALTNADVAAGRTLVVDASASGLKQIDGSAGSTIDGSAVAHGKLDIVGATKFANVFTGGALADHLQGGKFGDVIAGGGGNDTILGTGKLDGGSGNDLIKPFLFDPNLFDPALGQASFKTTITGGAGADVFDFRTVALADIAPDFSITITDFDALSDRFDLPVAVTAIDAKMTVSGLQHEFDLPGVVTPSHLHAHHAVVVHSNGPGISDTWLVVDANGKAGFQVQGAT